MRELGKLGLKGLSSSFIRCSDGPKKQIEKKQNRIFKKPNMKLANHKITAKFSERALFFAGETVRGKPPRRCETLNSDEFGRQLFELFENGGMVMYGDMVIVFVSFSPSKRLI